MSEYDFMNFSKDNAITTNITREEEIQFSDKVEKINKNGWKQNRFLLITDKAIYNLKNKTLKRRIDYKKVMGLTLAKQSEEFVIHCEDMDYDYHYISSKRPLIVEIISRNYSFVKQEELKLFEINLKNLNDFVTTKKEKEKQQKLSRMPKTGKINLKDYLARHKSKISINKNMNTNVYKNTNINNNINNNINTNINTNINININTNININNTQKVHAKSMVQTKSSPLNNLSVTYDDFEIISVIGRGSVGKILLVKNRKNGKYYAMKSMRKDQLVSEGIINNILIEKNILTNAHCEFLLTLNYYFQTPERIYYVCPFIKGGDLYHKLKQDIFFKEDVVRFYTAQVAIALQEIHDLGFAYRDLKPENILLDEDGYIKLCDFGSCASIQGTRKETSFAGSPEYAAPEMITFSGHSIMCDWWSFGILIYELLYGNTPFFNLDKNRMYDLINTGSISHPKFIEIEGEDKPRNYKISDDAKNIIEKLLEKDPTNRLGKNGLKEIKKHPFFSSISFSDLKKKKVKAPFKPEISKDNKNMTNNFDEEYLNLDIEESPIGEWVKEQKYESWFNELNQGGGDGVDDFEIITKDKIEDDNADGDDD